MRSSKPVAPSRDALYLNLMVSFLRALLGGESPDTPPTHDEARVAVAALLVEAALADGEYAASEIGAIDAILADHYELSADGAQALRRAGEAAQAQAADIVRFSRAVKDAIPYEQRIWLIERVWEVAQADGVMDHMEANLVRRLCGLLYVSDKDSGLARRRVLARSRGA